MILADLKHNWKYLLMIEVKSTVQIQSRRIPEQTKPMSESIDFS